MKTFMGYSLLLIIGIVVIIHFLKIVYILFKPKAFERFKSISNPNPDKLSLIIYYALVIVVSIFIIIRKIESLQW